MLQAGKLPERTSCTNSLKPATRSACIVCFILKMFRYCFVCRGYGGPLLPRMSSANRNRMSPPPPVPIEDVSRLVRLLICASSSAGMTSTSSAQAPAASRFLISL